MTLVDWEIKSAIRQMDIIVSDFDESLVNPASMDIRLGSTYGRVVPTGTLQLVKDKEGQAKAIKTSKVGKTKDLVLLNGTYAIDPSDKESFKTEYFEADEYVLMPHEFILASMFEHTTIPNTINAVLKGKSSIGRIGVGNSHQAGFIDNSWRGVLTMELYNYSSYPVILRKGMKIGQLVFTKSRNPENTYLDTGRYVDQKAGQGSLGV